MSTNAALKKFSHTPLRDKAHFHGCTQCHYRYEDACSTPAVDGVCTSCVSGRVSAYRESIEPRACCIETAARATDYDRITYKLAGPGPWWVCKHCRRQFPINPKEL